MALDTLPHMSPAYQPAGRLIPIFTASDEGDNTPATLKLTLSLAKSAAARGETVLMLDAQDGALMTAAGIIYHKTLGDVLYRDADITDVKYITSNEHFTACACGDAEMDVVLGSFAALSLSYDWVFVAAPVGCTPAHTRLAQASDVSVMTYSAASDHFMRAYWMMEAMRTRAPKFDPLVLSTGPQDLAVESALLLSDTIRQFLGAPPPYGGHLTDPHLNARILDKISEVAAQIAVA